MIYHARLILLLPSVLLPAHAIRRKIGARAETRIMAEDESGFIIVEGSGCIYVRACVRV